MQFAVLGWGSLVWNPAGLSIAGKWQADGPILPIEFSRVSSDGRLTLVIDHNCGTKIHVLYAISAQPDITRARANLQEREGTVAKKIGFVDLRSGESHGQLRAELKIIEEWARTKGFDGVVWTDLESNFTEKRKTPFTVETAFAYLKSQKGDDAARAWEYIARAPASAETRFRAFLREKH